MVAVVQYAQWRTANQKVVIDLYDRRLKAYSQIESAVYAVSREARVSKDTFYQFVVGRAEARFLFGDEVQAYLQELQEHFAWLISFGDEIIEQGNDDKHLRVQKVVDFFAKAPSVFGPYMNLSQKNTPLWRPW